MAPLTAMLLTPAAGLLVLAVIPGRRRAAIRLAATATAATSLLLMLGLWAGYDPANPNPQFTVQFPPGFAAGQAHGLGVDGLSLPLLGLAQLLTLASLLVLPGGIGHPKAYCSCVLLLQLGVSGVFCSQDWGLFFLFWQLALTALFFLINRWGNLRRQAASLSFAAHGLLGSVFMLVSLLAMGQANAQADGLLLAPMRQVAGTLPADAQAWVLLGFVAGFAANMAVFPAHGWLPLAHNAAPWPVNLLMAGVFVKMGGYGLLRAVSLLPAGAERLQPLLVGLALLGLVYGALLAWRQQALTTMLAFWSVSQMAQVMLGIASLDGLGFWAAHTQMLAHGLTAAALWLPAGWLCQQLPAHDIARLGLSPSAAPRLACLLTLALFAAMAMPGSAGFVALIHNLLAALKQWPPAAALLLLAHLLTAAYLLRAVNGLLHSTADGQGLAELRPVAFMVACALLSWVAGIGLAPSFWLAPPAQVGHPSHPNLGPPAAGH